MNRKVIMLLTLTLICVFVLPITTFAADIPPLPAIYRGEVVDQNGQAVRRYSLHLHHPAYKNGDKSLPWLNYHL
jgi:hypothetical protein